MRPRKSELYFEEIGERFNAWMSSYDVQQRITLIKQFMPESASEMSCLEVGCGTGAISEALAPVVGRLTVSDVSEKLVREVGQRLGTHWSRQDACNLDIPDETFDIVVSSECIEHTPDPRRALAEMGRVVNKGGVLIVTSPNKLWYPALWISMALKIRKFSGNEIWLYPREAARVLKENGFREVLLSGCHLFPWQVPFAKRLLPLFDRFGDVLYPAMINYGIRATKSG
jgi:2-polyprenyl-3-methyl-5-hydroxy-6-metoxy-1,4-benzoquinol methylase